MDFLIGYSARNFIENDFLAAFDQEYQAGEKVYRSFMF
jgi:hypothetical protein